MGTWNHGGVTALAVRCPSCELKGEVQGISGSRVPSAPSAHKRKRAGWSFGTGLRLWESEFRAENKGGPFSLLSVFRWSYITHFEVVRVHRSDVSGSVFALFFTDVQNGLAESYKYRAKAGGLWMCPGGCGVDSEATHDGYGGLRSCDHRHGVGVKHGVKRGSEAKCYLKRAHAIPFGTLAVRLRAHQAQRAAPVAPAPDALCPPQAAGPTRGRPVDA